VRRNFLLAVTVYIYKDRERRKQRSGLKMTSDIGWWVRRPATCSVRSLQLLGD
jgi:hypothetical protein